MDGGGERVKWVMEQEWNHVLFLHWQIDPLLIRAHVPFDLDLFEGKAVLSIVPFQMDRIRIPPLPVFPFFSSLWELNLRTYVTVNGVGGVYFFTLDTDSALGSFIANHFFSLPYRLAKIRGKIADNHYTFESKREDLRFQINARVSDQLKTKTHLDRWATDREHLFTLSPVGIKRGTVVHDPWRLQEVKIVTMQDRFSSQLPIDLKNGPDEVAYCRQLKVRFKPFQTIRS